MIFMLIKQQPNGKFRQHFNKVIKYHSQNYFRVFPTKSLGLS